MKWNTTTLAGTATLSALVVILDYALKYSNLKIPFPLLPYLRFDFTGIPVIISARADSFQEFLHQQLRARQQAGNMPLSAREEQKSIWHVQE